MSKIVTEGIIILSQRVTDSKISTVTGSKPEHAKPRFQEHICNQNTTQFHKHVLTNTLTSLTNILASFAYSF